MALVTDNIRRFVTLVDEALAVANYPSDDWRTKYGLIFSRAFMLQLRETDLDVTWCTINATYRESVLAFIDAHKEKADSFRPLLQPQEAVAESVITKGARRLVELADEVTRLITSEVPWEAKYDIIFCDSFMDELAATGIDVSWCDPDTSYEEDVRAFADELTDKANKFRPFLPSI